MAARNAIGSRTTRTRRTSKTINCAYGMDAARPPWRESFKKLSSDVRAEETPTASWR